MTTRVTDEQIEAGADAYRNAPEGCNDVELFGAIYLAMLAQAEPQGVTDELRQKIAREVRVAGKSPGLWTEGELAELLAKPPTIAELNVADAILKIPELRALSQGGKK